MASDVDICNMALAHLGADTLITSIDPPDGTVESHYCRVFYPTVRRAALEAATFDLTLKRMALASVANPSSVWLYAYALPADCLRALRVLRGEFVHLHADGLALGDELTTERDSAEFEIEGRVLLTNAPDAVLKYKSDVPNRTAEFPPTLVSAVAMLLAGYLAGPIIKGAEGRNVGQMWLRAGEAALQRAAEVDGRQRAERAEFASAFARARA